MASEEQPDIVFAEATPVVEPNYIEEPCPDCGGGGGGGSDPSRQNDNSRGDDPGGTPYGTQSYFIIKSIMLAATGDGDDASELQLFLQESDNYTGLNMPLKYRYRFDNAYRVDPTCNCSIPSNNTKIYGADGHVYEVPDVNHEGINYNFPYRWVEKPTFDGSTYWEAMLVGFFPLVNLSYNPDPWRLVLSDDDKDYQNFSRRRQSEYDTNVLTYHMNSGAWSSVNTGFTVERKTYGSSDDPILESGVRKITEANVQNRQNTNGNVIASNTTSHGTFRYVFNLEDY